MLVTLITDNTQAFCVFYSFPFKLKSMLYVIITWVFNKCGKSRVVLCAVLTS